MTQDQLLEIIAAMQDEINTLKSRCAENSVEIENLIEEIEELKRRSAENSLDTEKLSS